MTYRILPQQVHGILLVFAFTIALGGCAVNSSTPGPSRPADPSSEIETALQSLLEESGSGTGMEIRYLREESCLAGERVEHVEVESRWIGEISGQAVAPETSDTVLDGISAHLQGEGWELKEDVTDAYPDEIRSVNLEKGDLFVSASHRSDGPQGIEVFVSTGCWENPKGHQLVRSELDPDHGTPSSIYDDAR